MFNSKLFIAFLATLGVVGGASATALERRTHCNFNITLPILPPLPNVGTLDCCTSFTPVIIGGASVSIGANCTLAGSTCPPPRLGPRCCVPPFVPPGPQAIAFCIP
ncbi:hypothetical protein BC834DRAFT_967371 [Gloeopeniophorella convolvens]|nr:hypothetical protein BC834DRAFT_967371 [Gloeopeniophorella convolvens]